MSDNRELFERHAKLRILLQFTGKDAEREEKVMTESEFAAALAERETPHNARAYVCDKHVLQDGLSYGCCLWCQCEKYKRQIEASEREKPHVYICPEGCGCLWRDNTDGTMSLFNGNQKSCEVCEYLPLDKLTPLYLRAEPSTQPAQPTTVGNWCGHRHPALNQDCPQCKDSFGERSEVGE